MLYYLICLHYLPVHVITTFYRTFASLLKSGGDFAISFNGNKKCFCNFLFNYHPYCKSTVLVVSIVLPFILGEDMCKGRYYANCIKMEDCVPEKRGASTVHRADSFFLVCNAFHYRRLILVIYYFRRSESSGFCLQLCVYMCTFACTHTRKASDIKPENQWFLSIVLE